jgi:cell division protein FtsB
VKKKIAIIAGSLVVIVVCYILIKQAKDALQIEDRIGQETERLAVLQQENSLLKNKLQKVDELSFIETQARDKLNMGRSGETVVIISEETLKKAIAGMTEKKEEIIPNWQGWLRLFWK